ncbi:hypothetical protein HYDPIDRAFT_118309 [Hydnomerulius pinastri MD-312]|uniref:Uncharacterized protein n=1 Tax=Hydnomerulius pinastri MD-312 TaxID=994086 RepID=A0A0C9W8W4_9AGAM|nr:hypothetical protein HYDPIDRAFT_118309 [Hydnomerulius pinastri MD-312]
MVAKDNEHPKSSDSNNVAKDTPKPSEGDKEAKDEEGKLSCAREEETESVRNFLDMAAVFPQDQDDDPLAFLAAAQGDVEQGNIDTSKLDDKAQRRLFNQLQGALGRMKKAAESRPLKGKVKGKAREDTTPTPETVTAADAAQSTPSRKALDRLRDHLKKHTTPRKGKERETSESPSLPKQDTIERAPPRRERIRKRGERLRQRTTGRRGGQSADQASGESSSSPGNPVAPIRHYKVAYGQMNDRVVAAPVPDPDDDAEKSWGAMLFGWICYCTCIPYNPTPPRRQDESDESDESDSD